MELNLHEFTFPQVYGDGLHRYRREANIARMIKSGDQPSPAAVPATFIRGRRLRNDPVAGGAKPRWLKVRAPGSPEDRHLQRLVQDHPQHTVCEDAKCPIFGGCWHHGTATFMILGDVCTRSCGYCLSLIHI